MGNDSKKVILPASLWRTTKGDFQCSNSHLPLAKEDSAARTARMCVLWGKRRQIRLALRILPFLFLPSEFCLSAMGLSASPHPECRNMRKAVGQQRGYTAANTAPVRFGCCHTLPCYFSVRGTDPPSAAWQSCRLPANLNSVANNTTWETARNGIPLSWTGDLCKAVGLLLTLRPSWAGVQTTRQKLPLRHCLQCLDLVIQMDCVLIFSLVCLEMEEKCYAKHSGGGKKRKKFICKASFLSLWQKASVMVPLVVKSEHRKLNNARST